MKKYQSLVVILFALLIPAVCFAIESWQDLNNKVIRLYQEGKHAEALPAAEKALKAAESEYRADAPEVSLALNNLALIYKTQGKYDEAIALYERSLFLAEKRVGANHEDLNVVLNNLAALYEVRGNRLEADKIYDRIKKSGHAKTAADMKERAREFRE